MNLSERVAGNSLGYPEIGQTFYLVDGNYRTADQGWSKANRTGPLDLYLEKNPGTVFRTTDYSADYLAIQAAIDAMVDFRGDALSYTPGAYSLAAALAVNVPDARWLGPKVSDPRLCRATITAAIAAACGATAAADRMEVAFLEFVPLTAATVWNCAAAMDKAHFHDFFYNADGIAASTSTIFLTHAGATMNYWKINNLYMLTDDAQGPLVKVSGACRGLWLGNIEHDHEVGTLAVSLLTLDGVGTGPVTIDGVSGNVSAGGAVTALAALTDAGIDTQWFSARNVRGSIGYCASNGLIDLAGGAGATAETAEVGLAACYLDVISGGAGGLGTTYTA